VVPGWAGVVTAAALEELRAELTGTPMEPLIGIFTVLETMTATDTNLARWAKDVSAEVTKLWDDNAELRDELHALSNRIEAVTRVISPRVPTTEWDTTGPRPLPTAEDAA
jgi:hypothetical protein